MARVWIEDDARVDGGQPMNKTLEKSEKRYARGGEVKDRGKHAAGPRYVLLLEDNFDDASIAQEMVARSSASDFNWTHVPTLRDALEHLERESFDVALIDLSLPDSQGLDALNAIVALVPTLPIIVLTGQARDSIGRQAIENGAQDYLTKWPKDGQSLTRALVYGIERKRVVEALRASEMRFRLLVQTAGSVILCLSPEGRVLEWNHEAERVYGWQREEILGEDYFELCLPEAARATALADMKKVLAGEPSRGAENSVQTRDGPERTLLWNFTALPNGASGPLGVIAVGQDVTDRKLADEELRRAKEAAEAASRAKREFLANVSHEIRTPMNAILGLTELTLDSSLNATQRENLEIIKAATAFLLGLIEDLLDFSRIEAARVQLDSVPFDLRHLVRDILSLLTQRTHAKGLEIALYVQPDVPDWLIGDSARVRQILVNLIGNAIKFTIKGKVVVEIERGTCVEDVVEVRFHVIDSGIGIPMDKQEVIFRPFIQADGSTTRRYGGTGLGLAISSQLVELMGGRMWVDSEVGQGSTFHFTAKFMVDSAKRPSQQVVDQAAANEHSPEAPRTASPRNTRQPLRILVAEDHRHNQRVISLMLAKDGHMTTIVDNGREAVATWEREQFDVVLMDIQMPEMDGFEATAAIRAAEVGTGRLIPIIALTAYARQEDRDRCLAAGMDGYVSKPIQQANLRQAIEDCVFDVGAIAEAQTPVGATVSPMDLATALARVDGDQEFLCEMAGIFLKESPRLMAQIKDAVVSDDQTRLIAPAHCLKNWTGNFVALAAFEAVATLEAAGRAHALATAGTALAVLEREIERLDMALGQLNTEPAHLEREGSLFASVVD